MNIIQLIQKPQHRGAELFAGWLSEELKRAGHQVLLISIFKGKGNLVFSGTAIQLDRNIGNRFFDFRGWSRLAFLIAEFKPDIVQANAADTLKFSVFTRLVFGGKYRLIFNNGGIVSAYLDSFPKKVFNRFLFQSLEGLISVSAFSKIDLDTALGPFTSHEVIPIGIDLTETQMTAEAVGFPVLVHLAGFTHEKNHRGLLEIFREFSIRHSEAQLWLMGDGPERSQIQKLVLESGLAGHIRFFGAVEKPFALVPGNAILVLPSLAEGVPAVILEAFYANIPVVANAVGGIPELVVDGETGFLVEKGDQQAFVGALNACLELQNEEKQRMTNNAFKLVSRSYSVKSISKRFEIYYQQLCESSN